MGFFNFEKEGPGVSKDGPKKKGIFLFFELLGRKIGKFCSINMLYFLISIPMIAISVFGGGFFVSYFFAILGNPIEDVNLITQMFLFVSFLFVVFIGSGPASAALAYFNRCVVREKATFLVSDFLEHFKKNFKQGIIVGIINPLIIFAMLFAMLFYLQLSVMYPAYSTILTLCMTIMGIICVLFVISGFYIYQLMVTFENSIKELYKNSIILAMMNFPMNLLIMVLVFVVNFFLFTILSPIASPVVSFFGWIAIMRFALEFYTVRVVDKKIIKNMNKEGSN